MSSRDFASVESSLRQDGSPPHPTQQILLSLFSAIGKNDLAALPPYLTDDVQLHIHGFQAVNGSWTGRDNVIAAIGTNFAKIVDQKPTIQALIHQENHIAMLLQETGYLHETGIEYEAQGVLWFTFRDARIQSIREYLNVQAR